MEIDSGFVRYMNGVMDAICASPLGRPSGSPAHRAAADTIIRDLTALGLSVDVQSYPCPYWEYRACGLKANGAELPVKANPYTLPCSITAPLVFVNDLEGLRTVESAGRIIVLHGELASMPYFPRNFAFFRMDWQDEAMDLLEAKAPGAIIAVSPKDSGFPPMFEDSEFALPSVTVSATVGERLRELGDSPVTLAIDCSLGMAESSNIVARTRDLGPSDGRIVVCAHYDTKYGAPGAIDNASGVAAMMGVAKLLIASGSARGVEFVAFGSEDCHFPGDAGYFETNAGYADNVTLAINIDGVGVQGVPVSVMSMGIEPPETPGGMQAVEPYFEGDHALFAVRETPVIALSSVGLHGLVDTVVHTRFDTPDKTDPVVIAHVAEYVAGLVAGNL